jgi:hypothetical protein
MVERRRVERRLVEFVSRGDPALTAAVGPPGHDRHAAARPADSAEEPG